MSPYLLAVLWRGRGAARGARRELELEMLIGLGALVASLGLLTLLTFWSRRIVERIAAGRLGTLREVIKDLNGRQH